MPSYQINVGDVGDAIYRRQSIDLGKGNYLLDGGGVALGSSASRIETEVAPAVLRFGNEVVTADTQTVPHPNGDANDPRIDIITIDSNGDASRFTGDPQPADPPGNRYPNVRTPAPPVPNFANEVIIAVLWVPAGTTSSAELFNSSVTERAMAGDGLNGLQLLPGRDIQHQLDTAREGETLRGDRSQTIVVDAPLRATTPNITIRDLNIRFADNAANSGGDDILTLAADGITITNCTIDGNRGNNPDVNAAGIQVNASGCTVRDIRGRNMLGYLVSVGGRSSAVEDTVIRTVVCRDSRRGGVIATGAGTARTDIDTVRGVRLGEPSLSVFNGTTGTSATNIYGEDQTATVGLSDTGPGATPFTGLLLDNVRANGTRWIVENNTSPDVNNRGVSIQRVTGRNLIHNANVGKGFVDLSNLSDVRVNNAFIVGNFNGAHTIYANHASEVMLSNLSLSSDAQNRTCVGIYNTAGIQMFGVRCVDTPGEGIRIQNNENTFFSPTIITNCALQNIGKDEIVISAPGGAATMEDILIKNNRADVVTRGLDTAQPIIKDNMP